MRHNSRYVWITLDMIESDAWRSLGINEHRFLHYLMAQLMHDCGRNNGLIRARYRDLHRAGIPMRFAKQAIEKCISAGFVERVWLGRDAFARYGLTWLPSHDGKPASNAWTEYVAQPKPARPGRTKKAIEEADRGSQTDEDCYTNVKQNAIQMYSNQDPSDRYTNVKQNAIQMYSKTLYKCIATYTPSIDDIYIYNKNKTRRVDPPASGGSRGPWKAYAEAWKNRYGVEPARNAKQNAMLAQIGKRIPAKDVERLIEWYVTECEDSYVMKRRHALGPLLQDCEQYHAEMRARREGRWTDDRTNGRASISNPGLLSLMEEDG